MDLTEIETFLALAEELHFGRTAERLRLSQSRVSQLIRSLERRIGAPLFTRTSRRVALTPLGAHARRTLGEAHRDLRRSYDEAVAIARGVTGTLRLGFLGCLNGPPLTDAVAAFAHRHPACRVGVTEVPWAAPYAALRAGEIDLLLTLLPVDEPDLGVGAVLVSHPRVLALRADHPLAARPRIDVEELADWPVLDSPSDTPDTFRHAVTPPFTPRGRPLRRTPGGRTYQEALHRVAVSDTVWPTHRGLFLNHRHPRVRARPLTGLPAANGALVWRADAATAKVHAFVAFAAAAVEDIPDVQSD
ncbi:LysR substrate-binding domain-containing protein [Kitasatospora sp. YST-16]|uniref:LysR family transcriptional regulator n=1 Tax=unclassified Kitasatospora TaxID=2633591 RepID=UPI0004C37031|nr:MULTISPECIES: LysR substrate-binding domain-containing protein [unclassified Kitasatospora]WAL74495.1 LysR substrate-binding domain-containing protein [Kitasatospora sp. YST-16]WNW40559.1 LysR substrate-binding domain-containing protein [Streptomyces sp. Li-HN-5-13]